MVNEAIQRVRLALLQPGTTPAGLAKKAGLHPNTLYGADQDGWNPKANTLIALEPHLPPPEPAPADTQAAA